MALFGIKAAHFQVEGSVKDDSLLLKGPLGLILLSDPPYLKVKVTDP